MTDTSVSISFALIAWYKKNARDLPWRNTRDPYKIWLSEIILQQTSVAQGTDYYLSFIKRFPSIKHLAKASENDVLKMWEGLGYYSRARNIHFTAKYLLENNNGELPSNYNDLLKLKGVGPYTAAAIASFAFHLKHVVVDGNVLRLFSRLYGIDQPIDASSAKQKIWELGQSMIELHDPYIFNQAIMEFGAIQCTPKSPHCKNCVLQSMCFAFENNLVNDLPVKLKKPKKKQRFFQYTVVVSEAGKTLIAKRTEKDIWKGLYEFPLQELDQAGFKNYFSLEFLAGISIKQPDESQIYKQELTHQTIYSKFYKLIVKKGVLLQEQNKYKLVNVNALSNYAFPKTTCLYLDDNSITLD